MLIPPLMKSFHYNEFVIQHDFIWGRLGSHKNTLIANNMVVNYWVLVYKPKNTSKKKWQLIK